MGWRKKYGKKPGEVLAIPMPKGGGLLPDGIDVRFSFKCPCSTPGSMIVCFRETDARGEIGFFHLPLQRSVEDHCPDLKRHVDWFVALPHAEALAWFERHNELANRKPS
jgi:hypothetical protein